MGNREKTNPPQPETENVYTLDELLKMMEPQYQVYKFTMRQCIDGLTEHAAQLAAQGREEQVPRLRQLCIEMAEFWGLTEDDTPKGYREMADHFGRAFDNAVSASRDSGHAPESSGQTRQNVLDGLELYAQEMACCGDLEQWIAECKALSEQLQAEWQTGTQINMDMKGM